MLLLIVGLSIGMVFYYETLVFVGNFVGVDLLTHAREFTNLRVMKMCDDYFYMHKGVCKQEECQIGFEVSKVGYECHPICNNFDNSIEEKPFCP